MPRISLNSSMMDAFVSLAEGNPGAIIALVELAYGYEKIDPDSAFKGWTGLLALDSAGIYGADIWVLYKDICGSSVLNVVIAIRAVQLGISSWPGIQRSPVDFNSLEIEIKKELPRFNSN